MRGGWERVREGWEGDVMYNWIRVCAYWYLDLCLCVCTIFSVCVCVCVLCVTDKNRRTTSRIIRIQRRHWERKRAWQRKGEGPGKGAWCRRGIGLCQCIECWPGHRHYWPGHQHYCSNTSTGTASRCDHLPHERP